MTNDNITTLPQQFYILIDNVIGYERLAQLGGLEICSRLLRHLFNTWRKYYMGLLRGAPEGRTAGGSTSLWKPFFPFQDFLDIQFMALLCPAALSWIQSIFTEATPYSPTPTQLSRRASSALRSLENLGILPTSQDGTQEQGPQLDEESFMGPVMGARVEGKRVFLAQS